MRWWVGFLGMLLPAAVAFGVSHKEPSRVAITPELRASLTSDYEIDVVVSPHKGDAWTRLAKRVTGDAETWKAIAAFNGTNPTLTTDKLVHVPLSLLRPELQRKILETLFPQDSVAARGWTHVVTGDSGVEGESLWKVAEWFTGDGANYTTLRKANPNQALSTRKGDVIVIPRQLLKAAFGDRTPARSRSGEATRGGGMEEANAEAAATEVRKSEDDPVEHASENEDDPAASVVAPSARLSPAALTYERNAPEPYAVYRIRKGEALYSSVAIRFTGRVYARDVGDVLERIVKFNGIDDVARIRVGYPVKIPMELLLPEYLPAGDPARLAREEAMRASARLARRTRARGLGGVQLIVDAGHGGRDVGTTHDGLWESIYVYDVMCRLKRIVEKKSAAKVWVTTESKKNGYDVADSDVLDGINDHVVLTTPHYTLDDPVVGVNLRWYLANSIFSRALRAGAEREKVVFISIHADSLHPSLRGAMAYIPGQKYVQGSFKKSDKIYLTRAEVRERPIVSHSEKESLESEGLSRDLAESVIDSIEEAGLQVHSFNPIRDNVVRDGKEWVPAVIRYNLVPTRMLLEICNLGNSKDRALVSTRSYRQKVAESIYEGLVNFFDEGEPAGPLPVVAAR